jgi:hypothetical protein
MTTESSENSSNALVAVKLPAVDNPLGCDTLLYRAGTHTRFKTEMVKGLACQTALRSLAHADTGDPTMALVDAWSATLDVLTFYQERIANEGFLRTATEQRSVQELGRAVGYELNPGVAAETCLAFTLDDTPGSPEKVVIDVGTKVQSVPGPGEQPQVFETLEKIEARPEWNVLKPQRSEWRLPQKGDTEIYLEGVNTGLKPGDGILLVGEERKGKSENENWDFRRVKTVEPDGINGRTRITWDEKLGHYKPPVDPAKIKPEVYAFRLRAALFGYNAPDWTAMPAETKNAYCQKYLNHDATNQDNEWPHFTISEISGQKINTVHLDAAYPQIRPGSWLVLAQPEYVELYEVENAVEDAQANFTISGKTTRVTLKGENLKEKFDKFVRETMVFAQSEKLEIAEKPLPELLPSQEMPALEGASKITLDRCVDGLSKDRMLLITGISDTTGCTEAEWIRVLNTESETGRTVIFFTPQLTNTYRRASVTIYANVARATHGETRQEVLGSADAASSFQQLALRQAPLTYTPAATPTGGVDTLQIRINDILWDEIPTLYGLGPRDRVFTARAGADGKALVQFGDGTTGAQPPRGVENISAAYRIGLGTAGNVKTDQLRVLLSRLLGVRSVSNPLPATGGVDPEDADEARLNAPFTALTLDRIVSLHDYEDFARAFGNVAKVRADWLWNGSHGVIFLTVVAVDGKKMDADSLKRLRTAIDAARDPAQHVQVETTDALRFRIQARLVPDPHYRSEQVIDAAKAALRRAFSLKRRDFGQDVTESEILGVLQSVDGIIAADMKRPYPGSDLPGFGNKWNYQQRLVAQLAHLDSGKTVPKIVPAELWMLDASLDAVTLHVVSDLNEPEQEEGTS